MGSISILIALTMQSILLGNSEPGTWTFESRNEVTEEHGDIVDRWSNTGNSPVSKTFTGSFLPTKEVIGSHAYTAPWSQNYNPLRQSNSLEDTIVYSIGPYSVPAGETAVAIILSDFFMGTERWTADLVIENTFFFPHIPIVYIGTESRSRNWQVVKEYLIGIEE